MKTMTPVKYQATIPKEIHTAAKVQAAKDAIALNAVIVMFLDYYGTHGLPASWRKP